MSKRMFKDTIMLKIWMTYFVNECTKCHWDLEVRPANINAIS